MILWKDKQNDKPLARLTKNRKKKEKKTERKRKWLGETQRGSEFEEEVKIPSSQFRMCFGELSSLDMILCT